jgi:hypothetical protein
MTHKPDGKRLGWWSSEWLLAAMLFAPYIGAYYATYTMPIGVVSPFCVGRIRRPILA